MKVRRLIIVIAIVLVCLSLYFLNSEFKLLLQSKSEQVIVPSKETLRPYPAPATLPLIELPNPTPNVLSESPIAAVPYAPPESHVPDPYAPPESHEPTPFAPPVPQILQPAPGLPNLPALGIFAGLLIGIALGFIVHATTTFLRMKSPAGLIVVGLVGMGLFLYLLVAAFRPNFLPNLSDLVFIAWGLMVFIIYIIFLVDRFHFPWWVALFSQFCNFLWIFILFRLADGIQSLFRPALLLTVIVLELVSANQVLYTRKPTSPSPEPISVKTFFRNKKNRIGFILGFLVWNVGSTILWRVLQVLLTLVIFPNNSYTTPHIYPTDLIFFIPVSLTIIMVIISLQAKRYAFAYGIIAAFLINALIFLPGLPWSFPGMVRGIPVYIIGPFHIDYYWYAVS